MSKTFNDIFKTYYTLYRNEADAPNTSDDEYAVGLELANEALSRWSEYDNTYWRELFTTLQASDEAGLFKTITSGITAYDCPADFREAGGLVTLKSGDKIVQTYKIIEPSEVQFNDPKGTYAYFTGSPIGYILNLSPAPSAELDGLDIDYNYYKSPTEYINETTISEIPNTMFLVHRMLANRFRSSRNPYYSSAIKDAEEALMIMQLKNNSGGWDNPWKLTDNSGTTWGR